MNKTNAKGSVKLLQIAVGINQYQKEMDKIANDMAVLFDEKISASKLAKWLPTANADLGPNDDIIYNLGYIILPGLIDAKTKDERVSFLKRELPQTFFVYKSANESLFQLSENYFKKQKGLIFCTETIKEFMSVCLHLFAICEKFEMYEYTKEKMESLKPKA